MTFMALQPIPLSPLAHEAHHGKVGEILPPLFGFPAGRSGNFQFRNLRPELRSRAWNLEMSSPGPQPPAPNPSM